MLAVVVHGGAASGTSPRALEVCRKTAEIGMCILRKRGSALDAVVAAVKCMEDSGVLNAGNGSMGRKAPDGTFVVQMDAAVGTSTGLWAAVGAVEGIQHPIDFALSRAIAGESALLAGKDATNRAKAMGFTLRDPHMDELALAKHQEFLRQQVGPSSQAPETVGAIAVDLNRVVAVAASTGGFGDMELGRVGDVVFPGAGSWVGVSGAVLATGPGDDLINFTGSLRVQRLMEQELHPREACEQIVKLFGETYGLQKPVGFIALWIAGGNVKVGMGSNRADMPWHSIVEQ